METFAGEFSGLLNRLGSLDLEFVRSIKPSLQVIDERSLQSFLREYASELLFEVELPSICKAYTHAVRYECRELIELDKRLALDPRMQRFGNASSQIGRPHLFNLRPLRENRLIQRYLAALDAGEVYAWHTLVYGISLSIYSVPLRQGLLVYSNLVLDGFANAAAGRLSISASALHNIVDEITSAVPKRIDSLIRTGDGLFEAA